jgi:hypothetical protein
MKSVVGLSIFLLLLSSIFCQGGNINFSTFNASVPLGGCSGSPILITPTSSSSNDIILNTTNWTILGYYLLSNVTINSSLIAQNITICSFANATANVTLPVVLNGTNANLYTFNNTATANITITTTAAPTPNISIINITSTYGNTTAINFYLNR